MINQFGSHIVLLNAKSDPTCNNLNFLFVFKYPNFKIKMVCFNMINQCPNKYIASYFATFSLSVNCKIVKITIRIQFISFIQILQLASLPWVYNFAYLNLKRNTKLIPHHPINETNKHTRTQYLAKSIQGGPFIMIKTCIYTKKS